MIPSVSETFRDGTIFVTGFTGFLGKLLVEKLLRSCSVKNIVVIVRNQNNITAEQRILQVFDESIFDRLRKEKPDFISLVKCVVGDISNTSLGLSIIDRDWLIKNVNFIFHSASTIKFYEPLEVATKINIEGTEQLLELAKEMKNLKGIVYLSTAYSHCLKNEVKEQYYPVPITVKELKMKLKTIDESTPYIKGDWPNTYTFTKAITENVIKENENNLPISIARISMVTCTKYEPYPGWIDGLSGPPSVVVPLIIGFLRTVPLDLDKLSSLIPADYTINAIISVMWHTVNIQHSNQLIKEPKIFNIVADSTRPLIWRTFFKYVYETYENVPPMLQMWYYFCIFSSNPWIIRISRILFHRIPAIFMDLFLILCGKNKKYLKKYARLDRTLDTFTMFITREWKFDNSNIRELWSLLCEEDRQTFWFSYDEFDWESYIKSYVCGMKKHILHEDDSNQKKALIKNRRLFWLHNFSIIFIISLAIRIILYLLL